MATPGVLATRSHILAVIAVVLTACGTMVSAAGWPRRPRDPTSALQRGPGVSNHPVGMAPSAGISLPDGWPVDHNGAMTCFTCHYQVPPMTGAGRAFLRGFDEETALPEEFCMNCHGQAEVAGQMSPHWMAVRVAHVRSDDGRTRPGGGTLDEDSKRCLACHDGVSGPESNNATPWSRGPGALGDRERNHPVGVRYPSGDSGRRDAPFRSAALLPEQVRLPGGSVSCVSCHDLYAGGQYRLTVPIEGSKLCFTCHQMD